jgi:outer membrane lipoprotein-sorting protein
MASSVIRSLRTASTRRLLALLLGVVAAAGSVTAIAIAAQGAGERPPARDLALAVHDGVTAPDPVGVTAEVTFTNTLVDAGAFHGADPLLTGATGRLWIGTGHRFRLELQSGNGDAQIVSDGRRVTVFDGRSNRAWRMRLPRAMREGKNAHDTAAVPTVADIRRGLERLMRRLDVSAARPSNVGGRPAYTVRLAPRRHGGLVGAAELAWDAARGVPLRLAVFAVGRGEPVLELEVDDIDYGPVPASVFAIEPPPGAELETFSARARGERRGHGRREHVRGVEAVSARLPFTLSAPRELAGLRRTGVRLLETDDGAAALVTYGRGLGGLLVVQRRAVADRQGAASDEPEPWHGEQGFELPTEDIGGADAEILETALGTLVKVRRGDVETTVVGSVRRDVAVAAARGL